MTGAVSLAEKWAAARERIEAAEIEIPVDLLDEISKLMEPGAVTVSGSTARAVSSGTGLEVPLFRVIAPRPLAFYFINGTYADMRDAGGFTEADIAFFHEPETETKK